MLQLEEVCHTQMTRIQELESQVRMKSTQPEGLKSHCFVPSGHASSGGGTLERARGFVSNDLCLLGVVGFLFP